MGKRIIQYEIDRNTTQTTSIPSSFDNCDFSSDSCLPDIFFSHEDALEEFNKKDVSFSKEVGCHGQILYNWTYYTLLEVVCQNGEIIDINYLNDNCELLDNLRKELYSQEKRGYNV